MSDTLYEVIDPRFGALFNESGRLQKLFGGCQWAEGPAWFGGGRYLVWSDIPADRMLRFDETDGSVSVFRHPSLNANGNTVDRQAGSSPASMPAGASPAPSMTARSPSSPTGSRGGASTLPTMSS